MAIMSDSATLGFRNTELAELPGVEGESRQR